MTGKDPLSVLLAERDFLIAALDSLEEGIVACDENGILTLFNRASRRILELREAPLPPERWAEAYGLFRVDGKTPLPVEEIPLYRALKDGVVRNVEFVIKPKGRRSRLLRSSGRAIRGSNGGILGAIVAMQDLTELTQAQEQLRDSNSFLESLVENIPNMIFVKDASELRFVRFNRAGEELLGYARKELLGKNDFDFFPKDQARHFIDNDHEVLRGDQVVDIPEERILTRHHGERILHTKKIPIKDSNGKPQYLLGISEDITERKLAEERRIQLLVEQAWRSEVESANRDLRSERELREQFVAALSHDLRNPISAARSTAELIARFPDRVEKLPTLLARIIDSMTRADRMITDLLDVNRIKAGEKVPITISEFDLVQLVMETVDDLSTIHGSRFQVQTCESLVGHWGCDGMRRVLENLLNNAIKYGDPTQLITIKLEHDSDRVRLSVHNLGEAIPELEQHVLFEAFRRNRSAEKSGQKGWGIGLAIVKGIVEAHGGKVTLRSFKTEGTTFLIDLPINACA